MNDSSSVDTQGATWEALLMMAAADDLSMTSSTVGRPGVVSDGIAGLGVGIASAESDEVVGTGCLIFL